MNLRIHRTFTWVNTSNRLGGPPQWSLQAHDRLQYNDGGVWKNIPVVEADHPPNPDQQRIADNADAIRALVDSKMKKDAGE